jgi:replicative DNA helicase
MNVGWTGVSDHEKEETMTTIDDRLADMSRSHITVWEERIKRIDAGQVTMSDVDSNGRKFDATKEARAELVELIEFHQGFINSRGMGLVR